jgi:hypothetical protein
VCKIQFVSSKPTMTAGKSRYKMRLFQKGKVRKTVKATDTKDTENLILWEEPKLVPLQDKIPM